MARLWKSKEDVKEYLDRILIEYKYHCNEEKSPEGCYNLANYYENILKDFKNAFKLYKHACLDLNNKRSCFFAGKYKLLGKGCEQDLDEASEIFRHGCSSLNDAACCHNFAVHKLLRAFHKRENEDNSADKIHEEIQSGIDLLKKTCDEKLTDSCNILFEIYRKGQLVQRNMPEAVRYAELSCGLNSLVGCVNAAVAYKKGDGVEKNMEKFEFYEKKVKEIKDSMQKEGIKWGETHTQ